MRRTLQPPRHRILTQPRSQERWCWTTPTTTIWCAHIMQHSTHNVCVFGCNPIHSLATAPPQCPKNHPPAKSTLAYKASIMELGPPFQTDTTISPPINCSFPTLFVQCPDLCKFARRHTKLATLMRHIVRSSLCTPRRRSHHPSGRRTGFLFLYCCVLFVRPLVCLQHKSYKHVAAYRLA